MTTISSINKLLDSAHSDLIEANNGPNQSDAVIAYSTRSLAASTLALATIQSLKELSHYGPSFIAKEVDDSLHTGTL